MYLEQYRTQNNKKKDINAWIKTVSLSLVKLLPLTPSKVLMTVIKRVSAVVAVAQEVAAEVVEAAVAEEMVGVEAADQEPLKTISDEVSQIYLTPRRCAF